MSIPVLRETRSQLKPTLTHQSSWIGDLRQSARLVFLSQPSVRFLLLSSVLRFGAGLSIAVWLAPWVRLAHPGREAHFALCKALISIVAGTTSVRA